VRVLDGAIISGGAIVSELRGVFIDEADLHIRQRKNGLYQFPRHRQSLLARIRTTRASIFEKSGARARSMNGMSKRVSSRHMFSSSCVRVARSASWAPVFRARFGCRIMGKV